jgi:hypothetical protein
VTQELHDEPELAHSSQDDNALRAGRPHVRPE